jgi:hypothetical protein
MEAKHGVKDATIKWNRINSRNKEVHDWSLKRGNNKNEEFQRLKEYALNNCGYERNAVHSRHICLHSGKRDSA